MEPESTQHFETLSSVWKALSDPTRRTILDDLRQGPMTTGGLAARFDLSRFGVMKHLEVLVESGLVFTRKEGRQRWNHLNPVPIQQMYRRWIRPFETDPADALLRLKAVAEQEPEGDHEMSSPKKEFQTLDVRQEIRISAAPEKVWTALTEQTSAWWPKAFYVGSAPRGFHIEARVGGRVYEDSGNDQGSLWATVISITRGEMLQWVGDLAPAYGGPARSITTFKLKEDGKGGTVVDFHDATFGTLSADSLSELEKGWSFLLGECFKAYAEEGRQPERPETVN